MEVEEIVAMQSESDRMDGNTAALAACGYDAGRLSKCV